MAHRLVGGGTARPWPSFPYCPNCQKLDAGQLWCPHFPLGVFPQSFPSTLFHLPVGTPTLSSLLSTHVAPVLSESFPLFWPHPLKHAGLPLMCVYETLLLDEEFKGEGFGRGGHGKGLWLIPCLSLPTATSPTTSPQSRL